MQAFYDATQYGELAHTEELPSFRLQIRKECQNTERAQKSYTQMFTWKVSYSVGPKTSHFSQTPR